MKKFIPFALAIILGAFISCTLDVPVEPVDNGSGNAPVINPTTDPAGNPTDGQPTNPPTGNPVDNPPPEPTGCTSCRLHRDTGHFENDDLDNYTFYICTECGNVYFKKSDFLEVPTATFISNTDNTYYDLTPFVYDDETPPEGKQWNSIRPEYLLTINGDTATSDTGKTHSILD